MGKTIKFLFYCAIIALLGYLLMKLFEESKTINNKVKTSFQNEIQNSKILMKIWEKAKRFFPIPI